METGKYIVISTLKQTGQSSMSPKPKFHPTEQSAKMEAARLAQENPERDYSVLHVVATASVQKVVWR